MEEDPMTGTISKLPGKLDRLLRDGWTQPKGVADEILLIKGDLEEIAAISSDLEDDHAMTARCWKKEVRELSYDMEDFVDQYEHAHAVSCSRSMIRGRKRRKRLSWLQEKLRRRLWMANKIREFSRRTQEALQRHSLYNLDAIAGASASSRRTCAYSDTACNSKPCGEDNAYVGISDAMEELLMMMHDDHGHQKLKVVSIVGFGGIGKTTLATELYRKLGQQFECRAFVRTSQKPDMRRIFISMLSQVRPHQPPDDWTVHSLISTIRKHLQDKRYLIIVEDLCTVSTWDIVKYALPDSNCCSRILTTTEIEDLALQSCDHDPKYVYKMKPLGEDNSRKLFFGLVFGPQHECPTELREICCNIISKCGGLPLAIVTVASILSSQPGIQGQWDYFNKSIGESLLTNPTWEGMKQVLELSYNNLPQQLKACILYTSLYEEDIIIWKDDLVNQWIAEGFIQTTGGQDKKEIGRSFFERLISGKLILPVDINRNGEVLSCVIHRMVLNLVIRDKSMEENFVTAIHHSQADTTLADKVRRLSLQFGNAEDAIPPSNMRLTHVRTIAFSGVFKCLPSIEQFRLLQVLILHFWGDKDIISFDITRISELFRLRYLKVTSNVTLELGTQMQCLQSLETLAIDARVSAVPSDIVQLPGLLHLRLPAETNLPNGIGHMTSLRTLGYFDLSSNSLENVLSLSMLTNLRDLQLTCSTKEPESLNMKTPFLLMNMILERLSNLKSLTLVPTRTSSYYTKSIDDDTGATCMTISDGFSTLSSAPALLQGFEVSPRICIFFCTPKWIGQLHKLSILEFGVRKIDRDGVDVLRGLPALAVLSLYVHTKPAARIVIGKIGFPVIKYFKLKCCDPCLEFEEGAMRNLCKLKLVFNACNADQPSTMPVGIKYLSELKEVSAKIGGAGPEESQGSATEVAFRDAIRMNSRCQRVNVQCVKQIIGGEDDQNSMTTVEYQHLAACAPPLPLPLPPPPPRRRNQHDSMSRREFVSRTLRTFMPYEDGYQWEKYDERKISNTHFLRCYYKCIYHHDLNCRATKQEQVDQDGHTPPLYFVKYCNEHTCVAAQAQAAEADVAGCSSSVERRGATRMQYLTAWSDAERRAATRMRMRRSLRSSATWSDAHAPQHQVQQLAQAQPQPQPGGPLQPPPPQQQLSRYESQKRRDWNTFLQYLRNHRPPLTLAQCGGAHVIEFLRYLDQFGKTKVHAAGCVYFGQPDPPAPCPCPCPLHLAWGSLDALIGRLRAAYEDSGHAPVESNPFAARAVRIYLREVREAQSKARGISYEKKSRKRKPAASVEASSPPRAPGTGLTVTIPASSMKDDWTGKSPTDERLSPGSLALEGPLFGFIEPK